MYFTNTAGNGEKALLKFRGQDAVVQVHWEPHHVATIARLREGGFGRLSRRRRWLIQPVAGVDVSLLFAVLPLFDRKHGIADDFFPYFAHRNSIRGA